MLKDCNIDPPLAVPSFGANSKEADAVESIFGNAALPNSQNHAKSINSTTNSAAFDSPEGIKATTSSRTPRSSHKIVTPLRKQNSSFLVASLESLFSDPQGVSEQIAKITSIAPSSCFKSPASNLASSFASLCSVDSLTLADPSLLQSHVQKSLESSSIGLESPYKTTSSLSTCPMSSTKNNSLYNTPIRCKQSRSHDFSELPSQQRLKKRRSSILAQEEIGDLTTLTLCSPESEQLLSDLSHFKDNDSDVIDVITNVELTAAKTSTNITPMMNECDDEFNCFDGDKIKTVKTSRQQPEFQFNLPSTKEFQDGSKPPYSYASLIAQAIISSPKHRLALSNIYTWIMDTYPYYKTQSCGWQVNNAGKLIFVCIYSSLLFVFRIQLDIIYH